MESLLVLEDGTVFRGRSFGALGECVGEVVFNTGITGYQEIITDPSYRGQMVTMTYPHIGNTGINDDDGESVQPHLRALIVRDASLRESNWRARQTLTRYLQTHDIMALTDVDTRTLTRHIRKFGALRGTISTIDLDPGSLRQKALAAPTTSDEDLVAKVTCTEPYTWTEALAEEWQTANSKTDNAAGVKCNVRSGTCDLHVVAYDCGIKRNILRQLAVAGCRVTVVPAQTLADDVLAMEPDGIFLSNGPGDPENVPYTIAAVKELLGKVPIFGICLGHQVLGLAYGGKKYKLKFGHHGSNHPVKDSRSGQIAITAQNHNFAIAIDSLPADVEVTHLNLYDGTLEGMRHTTWPAFSVQYHPEAAPGPHDANPLFDDFVRLMRET
ncbi:MAG: glutamine-hydrolyzing carbamoyl-phosphate synthase small subunit [Anaerolineae bacterium]|nr:glutamine-hydrolyzing carbamoyl-phosphate synthase small subunit [Anaerolineae bacterium]